MDNMRKIHTLPGSDKRYGWTHANLYHSDEGYLYAMMTKSGIDPNSLAHISRAQAVQITTDNPVIMSSRNDADFETPGLLPGHTLYGYTRELWTGTPIRQGYRSGIALTLITIDDINYLARHGVFPKNYHS